MLGAFSKAVLLSFDQQVRQAGASRGDSPLLTCPCHSPAQANAQERSQANASLDALKASPEVWSFCMQAFRACGEDRVKFWCLQAMVDAMGAPGRWESVDQQQRHALRSSLTEWAASKGGPQTDEQSYVKNKYAQLVVALVRADYPERWPEVFPTLLSLLGNGEVAVDLFLRVLLAVHEEVVSAEFPSFNPQVIHRLEYPFCRGRIRGRFA